MSCLNDEEELLHLIALGMAPSFGPVRINTLIEEFGNAREVFRQSISDICQVTGLPVGLVKGIGNPKLFRLAEKELRFIDQHQICCLRRNDPNYPAMLAECSDSPPLLYHRGRLGLNCTQRLSVVGTRKASSYGRDNTRRIIAELAELVDDLVIVSGLAYGIDIMAHRAALEFGLATIAVLAHGFSTLYPQAHRETAERITSQGALVSDFPSTMGPEKNNFLRRNRIIAGWSEATLVVESPSSGGAMITAHLASSYGRELMAVPGRTEDRRSRGCNALIKEPRAQLVESGADIASSLNWASRQASDSAGRPPARPDGPEQLILQLIEEKPGIHPELIAQYSKKPIHELMALLSQWELEGRLSVDPGMRYRLRT